MKQPSTYFKVGLFVLLCLAGLLCGLLFVQADALHGEAVLVETYIDESVQGLNVGSDVLHRGVKIGSVKEITFVYSKYKDHLPPDSPEFKQFSRYVMVVMAIDPRRFPGLDENPMLIKAMLRNQASLGLRFKLSYQGITGISFLEADYVDPERDPELQVPWVPEYPYIASSPSLFTSFTQALESVFLRLEKIDFEKMFGEMTATLEGIQTAVKDANVAEIRQSAVAMMDDFKATNAVVQQFLSESDSAAPGNLRTAIQQFSDTLGRVDGLLAQHEMDIDAVLTNLKIVVENLRQISDSIKDNPARLLFSAPPAKSEVVQ